MSFFKAVLECDVQEDDLPEDFEITWSGGEAIEGSKLKRNVSKSSPSKLTVTATACDKSYSMIVYVIWAEPTDFRPRAGMAQDGGFDDYIAADQNGPPTGRFGPDADGVFKSVTQSQLTVAPPELSEDGGKVFRASDVKFDLHREVRRIDYDFKNGRWEPSALSNRVPGNATTEWYNDDASQKDEDQTPWGESGNGHIYNSDRPGRNRPAGAGVTGIVYHHNFREWARVIIGDQVEWDRCSENGYWFALRSVVKTNTGWREHPDFSNDCGPGHKFWGNLPQEFIDRMVSIKTNSPLNPGTRGAPYNAVIQADRAAAYPNSPVRFGIADGTLPEGLQLIDTGVISGTPMKTGTFRFIVEAMNDEAKATGDNKDSFADLAHFAITISGP